MTTFILTHTFNAVQNVTAVNNALGEQAGSRGPLPLRSLSPKPSLISGPRCEEKWEM